MFRRLLLLPVFLWLFAPVYAQNTTGYPLPDKLQPITLENASQLQPLASIGGDLPGDLAWSPDGNTLAVGTTGGVRLYDAADWKASPRQLPGWKDVRFDAAGNLISDGKVRDLRTGAVVHDDVPTSPSGKLGIAYRQQVGKAVVVLTNFASGKQTVLNTGLIGTVNRVAFSPDEQYVAIEMTNHEKDENGWDEDSPTAQLWNATTGSRIASLQIPGIGVPIDVFAFHAQGKLLVFSSQWGAEDTQITVKIWDGRTGQEIANPPTASPPVRFSSDDRWMTFPNADGMALWSDHEIGNLGDPGMVAAFSPDNRLLAGYAPSGNQIKLWTLASAQKLEEANRVLTGKWYIHGDVLFSPDGSLIAVDEQSNNIRVWDVETGEAEAVISNINVSMQFSPDSRWILTSEISGGKSALWDARSGERLMQFDSSFAFNPTWTIVAQWKSPVEVSIVALPTGETIDSLKVIGDDYIGKILRLDASAERILFSTQAWDTRKGQLLFKTSISKLPEQALSRDWKRLLMIGNPSDHDYYSNAFVQEPSLTSSDTPPLYYGDEIHYGTIPFLTPDGNFIGYAIPISTFNGPSRLEFRTVETGNHVAEWTLPGTIQSIAIGHNGKLLALSSKDETSRPLLIFLDLSDNLKQASPQIIHISDTGLQSLGELAFSADDSYLALVGYDYMPDTCYPSCGSGAFVAEWNVMALQNNPGDQTNKLFIPEGIVPILSVDGRWVLATSETEGTLQLWDTTARKQIAELPGDAGIGAFSPDGQLLAVHRDGNTLLYRVKSLLKGHTILVATIPDKDKPVKELAFNPDGTILYVMSDNRLWLYGVPG
jgi:WD40 repeat protein